MDILCPRCGSSINDHCDSTCVSTPDEIAKHHLRQAISLIYDHHELGHVIRAHENPTKDCDACTRQNKLKKLYEITYG